MFNSLYQYHSHFLEKPINQLYISMAVRSFGMSIIGLFIPIYLHVELGYSIQQTLTYFIALAAFFLVCSPLAAMITHRIGVKHTMFLSTPFYIVGYGLLYLVQSHPMPLWILGMMAGIGSALFWLSYHYTFFIESDKRHIGEEMGIRIASGLFAHFFGPIVGGVLMKEFGFLSVFLIGSITLFISSYIVLLSKDIKTTYRFEFKKLWKHFSHKLSLYYVSRGVIDAVSSTIWPLILFTIFQSYISLGAVSSLVTLINIVIAIKVGKWIDSYSKQKVARTMSFIEFLNWGIRPFLFTTSHMIGTSIVGSIFGTISSPAIGSLEYKNAAVAKEDKVTYFVQREMFISLGRLLILFAGFYYFSNHLMLLSSAFAHLIVMVL